MYDPSKLKYGLNFFLICPRIQRNDVTILEINQYFNVWDIYEVLPSYVEKVEQDKLLPMITIVGTF